MSITPEVIFTVCTPTYNRCESLVRVWDSLCAQTWRRFEWLVVDDGSTDGTRELVERWMAEADFPVRYFWQVNQHKKTAMNRAANKAKGELFLVLDSDDTCPADALERFWKLWNDIPESARDQMVGVTGLCCDEAGNLVGDRFPCADFMDSTGAEIMHRWKVRGEKWGFVRTAVMREFPFPDEVMGYVPESYVWRQMELHYRTRFVNEVLRTYYRDLGDSLITTGQQVPWRYSDGCVLGYAMDLRVGARWWRYDPIGLARLAANCIRQAFHSFFPLRQLADELWTRQPWSARMLLACAAPVGFIVWCNDVRKADKSQLKAHRAAARSARQAVQV